MDKKNRMLVIHTGITKEHNYQFRPEGFFKIKCPCCGMPIEIKMSGLKDNQSLSPIINIEERYSN